MAWRVIAVWVIAAFDGTVARLGPASQLLAVIRFSFSLDVSVRDWRSISIRKCCIRSIVNNAFIRFCADAIVIRELIVRIDGRGWRIVRLIVIVFEIVAGCRRRQRIVIRMIVGKRLRMKIMRCRDTIIVVIWWRWRQLCGITIKIEIWWRNVLRLETVWQKKFKKNSYNWK